MKNSNFPNKKKWEDAVIVDWSETKGYELMLKDRLSNSVPRTSFPAEYENKLVEFWEQMKQEVEVAEIEQQIEGKKREEKIASIERNGAKIVNCVKVEREVKQSRRRRIVNPLMIVGNNNEPAYHSRQQK